MAYTITYGLRIEGKRARLFEDTTDLTKALNYSSSKLDNVGKRWELFAWVDGKKVFNQIYKDPTLLRADLDEAEKAVGCVVKLEDE